jgi:KDO2-lipid IV(A) lauroyltransferase
MREGTLANAARILGPDSSVQQRIAMGKGVVANFYEFIYEIGRNRRRTAQEIIGDIDQMVGSEHYEHARRHGKGLIVVTAHLGSFETGVAALIAKSEKVHVVFRRDEHPKFERLRSAQRKRLGVREAPVDGGLGVWLRLRDALKNNEVVLMQGDRVMPGQRGVKVRFLSGHMLIPTGPVKLALTTGAPIIPVFSVRTSKDTVRVYIEPPIFVPEGSDAGTGIHPAIPRMARVIERYVSKFPDQWLAVNPMFHEDSESANTPASEESDGDLS